MIQFKPTTEADRPTILEWIMADPYHRQDASDAMVSEMVTGVTDHLIACEMHDDEGRVFFLNLKKDGDYLRIGAQFAPPDVVSKKRVAQVIVETIQALKILAQQEGAKGLILESISPLLIKFMASLGFKPYKGNDYVWAFEEKN